MNFDSPNFPSLCSLSAIISFQTCSNKCILYVLLFYKCIKIKYKTVNMYGVFLWLVQSSSRWNTMHTLIATTMFNCWVFGSTNSVTRPDRDNQYNMRIVYTFRHIRITWTPTLVYCLHMLVFLFPRMKILHQLNSSQDWVSPCSQTSQGCLSNERAELLTTFYIHSNWYFRWTIFGFKVLNPIVGEHN